MKRADYFFGTGELGKFSGELVYLIGLEPAVLGHRGIKAQYQRYKANYILSLKV
jgi:hypothetical protein